MRINSYDFITWTNIYKILQEQNSDKERIYRKISNIRHTNPQNVNDSRLVLQLSLPNPLKPGVKSRMKM